MKYSQGKRIHVNIHKPLAIGACDRTGYMFPYKDLVKEQQWRGNRLQWTGFLVGREYVDPPNPALRVLRLKPDPVPVRMPRLPQGAMAMTPFLPYPSEAEVNAQFNNWDKP